MSTDRKPASMNLLFCLVLFHLSVNSEAQQKFARWCTVGDMEQRKCLDMKKAFAEKNWKPDVECLQVEVGNACLWKIEKNEIDLVRVTDPTAFTAGRFHNLVPILHQNSNGENFLYKTVAVIRRDNKAIKSISDLKGKKSCHTGVGKTAGWQSPISNLNARNLLPIVDCENNVKNAAAFFSKSCAPRAFDPAYDPDQDNPASICSLCNNTKCPSDDKYSGYTGAFRCLVDGKGEVAFVKHSTVPTDARGLFQYDTIDYQLLCADGSRDSVNNYEDCSWATRPNHAVFTRPDADIDDYKRLFERGSTNFGRGTSEEFQMFNSTKYGGKNLLFTDGSFDLVDVGKRNTYIKYLGQGFTNFYEYIRPKTCRKDVRMCVVSPAEWEKCSDMRDGMSSRKITIDFSCILGKSREDCMSMIRSKKADLTTADDRDTYLGGVYYGLTPLMGEKYPGADDGVSHWAVAVARKGTAVTINTLKGMKTCHTGIWESDGWNIPIGYLVNKNKMKVSDCHVSSAAASYFGGSCAPGALDNKDKLCSLCKNYCSRNGKYSGDSGAFRCLIESAADVTFVRHTTVSANTDGNNQDDWAKNLKSTDFDLLCKDGIRKPVTEWRSCNLGKVPSRALLTHTSRADDYRRHYKFVFSRTDRRFGKNSTDMSFKLFGSQKGSFNLIFRDDTSTLQVVPGKDYSKWLGNDYVNYARAVDVQRCTTSGTSFIGSNPMIMCAAVIVLLHAYVVQ